MKLSKIPKAVKRQTSQKPPKVQRGITRQWQAAIYYARKNRLAKLGP